MIDIGKRIVTLSLLLWTIPTNALYNNTSRHVGGHRSHTRNTRNLQQEQWTTCAFEHGICAVDGTATVRYGAEGKYITKIVTGEIACTNQAFGNDPIFGVVKTCYVNTINQICAIEDGICAVDRTATVRYEAEGKYITEIVTGEIVCTYQAFGNDPIYGVAKTCASNQ